jgi:glycosyltransferase involved in cell wall biosynthesis
MNTSLRPRVTVILTTYNKAETLSYSIESVLKQTFTSFELWVIGDGCTDNSEDVVNRFDDPRILWFNLPDNYNDQSRLFYEGLRRARGEYVAYLTDRDLWLPIHLEVLINRLDSCIGDIALSLLATIHSSDHSTVQIPTFASSSEIVPEISTVLHRKNVIEKSFFESGEDSFAANLFQIARRQNLKIEVVSHTTGLKFLADRKQNGIALQQVYLERLQKDADFMNKELSAILVRAELAMQTIEMKDILLKWISKPLQRMMRRFLTPATKGPAIKIFEKQFRQNQLTSSKGTNSVDKTSVPA